MLREMHDTINILEYNPTTQLFILNQNILTRKKKTIFKKLNIKPYMGSPPPVTHSAPVMSFCKTGAPISSNQLFY